MQGYFFGDLSKLLDIFAIAHSTSVHHAHRSSRHMPGVPSSLVGAIGQVFFTSAITLIPLSLGSTYSTKPLFYSIL